MKQNYLLSLASALAMTAAGLPGMAAAQEVTLRLLDGTGSISGVIRSDDEDVIIIETELGTMQVTKDRVACEGATCPIEEGAFIIKLASTREEAEVLLPTLSNGFASNLDAEAIETTDGANKVLSIEDFDGEQLGTIEVKNATGVSVFDLLKNEEASIILTNNPPSESALQASIEDGLGDLRTFDQERVIAVAGLAIAVNQDNPVSVITTAQVGDILSGAITNWDELNGPSEPINLYTLSPDASNFGEFDSIVLEKLDVSLTENTNVVGSQSDIARAIVADPYGFGITNYTNLRNLRALPVVNGCGMTIPPTEFSIKTEQYPFRERIYVYNNEDVALMEGEFLDFLDSSELDGLVSRAGFIDQSAILEEDGLSENRIRQVLTIPENERFSLDIVQDMMVDLVGSTRLSSTFRFEKGQTGLDVKARRDIARVVEYLKENPTERALIVGFADSFGDFAPNLELARARATVVADEIREGMPPWVRGNLVDLQIRAYGELAPVACNESAEGRRSNRRVEIWLQ